jgi:hypothetical protein
MTEQDLARIEAQHEPPRIYTAAEIMAQKFEPLVQYVEGLVVEGLGVIGGKPKLGKSWLVLGLAAAIASGGVALSDRSRTVRRGKVLYLALEDGRRRLQSRLKALGLDHPPAGLRFATEWPHLGVGGEGGGLDLLRAEIEKHRPDVVFIDTLQKVRSPRKGRDPYGEDYAALGGLHGLARDFAPLAIYVVHHNRKNDRPEDYVDALSGTTGIGGAADTVVVLARARGEADAILSITGRDIEETERALQFKAGLWHEVGSATEWRRTEEQSQLVALAGDEHVSQHDDESGRRVLTIEAVAAALEITNEAARQRLSRSVDRGDLVRVRRGMYALPQSQPSQRHNLNPERDNVTDVTGSAHEPLPLDFDGGFNGPDRERDLEASHLYTITIHLRNPKRIEATWQASGEPPIPLSWNVDAGWVCPCDAPAESCRHIGDVLAYLFPDKRAAT